MRQKYEFRSESIAKNPPNDQFHTNFIPKTPKNDQFHTKFIVKNLKNSIFIVKKPQKTTHERKIVRGRVVPRDLCHNERRELLEGKGIRRRQLVNARRLGGFLLIIY
jgi:hypothetical protein